MRFLAPGFAALIVLGAVPVLIHLLGRPRAERRPFPALRFLVASDRKLASRSRLRERLLLALRALAMATIPLLLARPFLEREAPVSGLGGLGFVESAVIVVDDSRSLGYVLRGAPLFDRVRTEARRIVEGLGRGSEATVMLCSGALATADGNPLPELTPDRDRLRQTVAALAPSHRDGDTSAALRRAAALLGTSTHARRRVYLLSDMAAHGFSVEPPWAPGAGPELVPVDVRDGAPLPNRAIVDVKTEPAPSLGPRGLRISVEVANDAPEPVKELPVTLRIDGKAVAKGLVDVPAGGRAVKRFLHVLAPSTASAPTTAATATAAMGTTSAGRPSPRLHDGEVALAGDALTDDDTRWFRLSERRSVRVLLVDGDPRTGVRRDDELYYLETALAAAEGGDGDDTAFAPTVALLDDLERGAHLLDGVDVVFLANVKAPTAAVVAALRAFVERGGGLFLSLGSNVDPDAWNAALGDLLPQPLATLRTVGETLDARTDGEARAGGPGERVGRFDGRHPVLAPFLSGGGRAHGAAEGLREARVGRLGLLRPGPAGQEARRVLLRTESGAPLLVEGTRGEGRVLLLTTTLDRDWSDLAIQPAYLPLLQQATRYLAGSSLGGAERPTLVGQPHALPLEGDDRRVEVTAPSGKARRFDAERLEGRRALEVTATDEPGLHRVAAAGAGDALRPRPALDFAVNVDPRESDMTPIDPARLAPLEHAAPTGDDAPPRQRIELWHALGAILLALLLAESLVATRRAWRR